MYEQANRPFPDFPVDIPLPLYVCSVGKRGGESGSGQSSENLQMSVLIKFQIPFHFIKFGNVKHSAGCTDFIQTLVKMKRRFHYFHTASFAVTN